MWDSNKEPGWDFYKHALCCVWATAMLGIVYSLCCQRYGTRASDWEVSCLLFLGYYSQLLRDWRLMAHYVVFLSQSNLGNGFIPEPSALSNPNFYHGIKA